uniref:Protein kinase domain-containing protein n=1 Tax=Gadus morhua TaxID=8049 RepID=A0A8C5AWE2_GADMO
DFKTDVIYFSLDFIRMKHIDLDNLKVIGKGNFGKAFLEAVYWSVALYVRLSDIQEPLPSDLQQSNVMVERNVLLKGLQHPFLMGLQFSFQTTHRLYFVLEYVNGGDVLRKMDGSFPEPSAAFYAAEIATALGNLPSLEVVYRDMKPENILPAVDRWGLGTVLFETLHGLVRNDTSGDVQQIINAPLKLAAAVSSTAQSLLTGLLERGCSKRLGWIHDFEMQDHAFFVIPPPFIPDVARPCDVPSLGGSDKWQGGGANETFLGFTYMSQWSVRRQRRFHRPPDASIKRLLNTGLSRQDEYSFVSLQMYFFICSLYVESITLIR